MPAGREEEENSGGEQRVESMPRLGGLRHHYDLAA